MLREPMTGELRSGRQMSRRLQGKYQRPDENGSGLPFTDHDPCLRPLFKMYRTVLQICRQLSSATAK